MSYGLADVISSLVDKGKQQTCDIEDDERELSDNRRVIAV
jgi:hypothetical protein